ncbi:ColS [Desulforapulum autotrophicum HRM2]|uniref:histidine kinase n=1 Tax=Desulforapulum autotrophicum (strain ATCC 43914 / DSM 3382 / VKM B-1955 / HRM2) TaxID=177437 RepID=C0QGI6_DESAH|nr:ATP-binding protein [Desulforapulum autotrophicum]ACN13461.1 ColS [Desulforapulum autotrophicum HRM2]
MSIGQKNFGHGPQARVRTDGVSMNFLGSIRFRIIATILLFGFVLILLNSSITFFFMGKGMTGLVKNLLATEVEYFEYRYGQDRTTPLPHSKYIRVFRGINQVPERFRNQVKALSLGIHSIRREHPIHIAVMAFPDTKDRFYLFFHGRQFMEENNIIRPGQVILISIAVLLVPGILLGMFTSRAVLAPMGRLMEKIRALKPENLPAFFSDKTETNEIGVLTTTLEQTMSRIREFIDREKEFTRDASHELRTPLTIVKGAVEIIESQPEAETNGLIKRPLARIKRSVSEMEQTIETFLWLAREDVDSKGRCRAGEVVDRVVEGSRHLLHGKAVKIEVRVDPQVEIAVKAEILHIVMGNLLKNALDYTREGKVILIVEPDFLEVSDTGMGIDQGRIQAVTNAHVKGATSSGFGLGLNIVKRLCTRFGWDMDIASQPGKGTRVRILYRTAMADRALHG